MQNRIKTELKLAVFAVCLLVALCWWIYRSTQPLPPPPATPDTHPPATLLQPAPTPAGPNLTPSAPQTGGMTNPTPASLSNPQPAEPADPTRGMPLLHRAEIPDPTRPDLIKRVRIVRANFKYPLWRVEEVVLRATPHQEETIQSRNIMIADHVMIRLATSHDTAKLEALVKAQGLIIRKTMKIPGSYLISIPDETPTALPRLLAILGSEKQLIRYVEPDYVVRSQQTLPNDPLFSNLWGLNNSGNPSADISAPEIWDLTPGSTQLVIGAIDTGIDYNHPDLTANIWTNPGEVANGLDDDGNGYIDDLQGWNFNADNNNPMDNQGHGTHTAGTIGAVGNNGIGVAGVAWRCRMIPLKFLDNSGYGIISDAAEALTYVAALRRRGVNIKVTNNSWGGGGYSSMFKECLEENAALDILFMAAAGNDSLNNDVNPFYPASYTVANVLSVAASDASDRLAYFSHYGTNSVHLAAPGLTIFSTMLNSNYGNMSGTSMATPHVTGVAALLWSLWPSARAADVRDAILKGVDPIPSLTGILRTGGRLNARKSVDALFRIVHSSQEKVYNTGLGYALDIEIGPPLLVDTNQIFAYWAADGATQFNAVACLPVSNALFRALIPEHVEGHSIQYWFQATSVSGLTVRLPAGAPESTFGFTVVHAIPLVVSGYPTAVSNTIPDYGTHTFVSGLVVNASAPATTSADNGTRQACDGWLGAGSVPGSGATNSLTFTLTTNSSLAWQWRTEYALSHTSIYRALNTTTWWSSGTTATSKPAPASITLTGVVYRFSGWELDGSRYPDGSSKAINPVVNIPMLAPHQVKALYLPEAQDSDTNGLKDWWEFFYLGAIHTDSGADRDGDGFNNYSESLDQTDPSDPASRPTPPLITHTPLTTQQPRPAPYAISALITDNCQVVTATLRWNRNGGPTLSTLMSNNASGTYSVCLPAPGVNGDQFTYWIEASDRLATSTNGPHTVMPCYPEIHSSPIRYDCLMLPGTTSNLHLNVTNWGIGAWRGDLSILWGGLSNDVEAGAGQWTHKGINDMWTVTTNWSASGTRSWYCGNPDTLTYGSSMHAKLDTTLFYVATHSRLTFTQWMKCEMDGQFWRPGWKVNNCWDGGIVEISTNAGASFTQIAPIGGYPHEISGYAASPWPDGTLCFAGTGETTTPVFDLSAYAGSVATLRFHFGTDDNTEETGWFIDDISVTPIGMPGSWVAPLSTNLTATPRTTTSVPLVSLTTTNIPTGDLVAVLQISDNTPTNPITLLPIHLKVRSPATFEWVFAGQTSTNGGGLVTFSHRLYDADGDNCEASYEWTTESGVNWSNAWLTAVQSDSGAAVLTGTDVWPLSNLITRTDAGVVTNVVHSSWNSAAGGNLILFSSNTLVRARTWDGLFLSSWATSQPFMVDNEMPPPPSNLVSLVHQKNAWSKNPVMSLRWDPVQEKRGSGVSHYEFGNTTNATQLTIGGTSTGRTGSTPPSADGTNFWAWVRTCDRMGNASQPVVYGPCWIDATPPSAAQALITLALDPGGNYVTATNAVFGTWSGFTDGSGSGLAGYYFSLTNGGGTTKGSWTPNAMGLLAGLKADSTNTFHVWAKDQTGWIGQAVCVSFICLTANGDWDADGALNWQEYIAGSDALTRGSIFQLGVGAVNPLHPGSFTLQWPGLAGRRYAISYRDTLAAGGGWHMLPGATNLPGVTGLMSFMDSPVTNRSRFYRISITSP